MHKLTIRLVNGTAPLDQIIFTGERIKDIYVENSDDYNQIIDEATSFLHTIKNADKTIVSVRISKENGGTLLNGVFQEGKFVRGILIT